MIDRLRQDLVNAGRRLYERGLSPGTSGNMSVRTTEGWLATPSGHSLGALTPESLSLLDRNWDGVDGSQPTKEIPFHRACYEARPDIGAVVHLHSVHAVALSCLADVPIETVVRLTPYFQMRVGRMGIVSYHTPGAPEITDEMTTVMRDHEAALLRNHGSVATGHDLAAAIAAAEEIEASARLCFIVAGHQTTLLPLEELDRIQKRFPL